MKRKEALVKDLMTTETITVSPKDTLSLAFFLFHTNPISNLPVVGEGKKIVGMISYHDIKRMLGPLKSETQLIDNTGWYSQLKGKHVSDFISKRVIRIKPERTASHAAKLLIKNKIGALPVEKNGKLVGIITETDILRDYIKVVAPPKPKAKR
jgi:acetoin utilization protein AcuB